MVSCLTVVKVSEASTPFEILYSDNHISMYKAPRVPFQYGFCTCITMKRLSTSLFFVNVTQIIFFFFLFCKHKQRKKKSSFIWIGIDMFVFRCSHFFFSNFQIKYLWWISDAVLVVLFTALPCAFLNMVALILFPFSLSFALLFSPLVFLNAFAKNHNSIHFFLFFSYVSGEPFGFEQLSQLNLNLHRLHWTRKRIYFIKSAASPLFL